MKRVIQRKAKQGIYDELLNTSGSLKKRKHASQDIGNKTRTSAAMLGLALSVGASGSILSGYNKRAVATQPPSEGVSSVQGSLDHGAPVDAPTEPSIQTFSHVIREGETLWILADHYGISSSLLLSANGLEDGVVLNVGQTIQVPATGSMRQESHPVPVDLAADTPQSDPEQVPVSETIDEPALNNLAHMQVKATAVDISQENLDKQPALDSAESVELSPISEQGFVAGQDAAEAEVSEVISDAEMASKPSAALTSLLEHEAVDHSSSQDVSEQDTATVELLASVDDSVSVSLNQPMLVAESIAFSNLESEPSESSVSPLPEAIFPDTPSSTATGTHQIQAGETLASIAQQYGISTSELAEANGIRNPNRIFAGRVLNLPAGALSRAATPSDYVAVPRAIVTASSTDYTIGFQVQDSQVQDSQVQDSQVAIPNSQVSVGSPDSDVVASSDFYVQRLLDEIETMSATHPQVSSEVSPSVDIAAVVPALDSAGIYTPSDAAITTDDEVVGSLEAVELSTPEVIDDVDADVQVAVAVIEPQPGVAGEVSQVDPTAQPTDLPSVTPSVEEPQLVAASPLGSENYVPLSQPVTGRMVSPDLPPLLEPENYIPTGPGHFNGYIYPAQGTLTSGYGWRWGRMHRGIDVAAPVGTPIVAAAPGVIEFAGWNSGGYGNMVDIRHPDGSRTRYAHNNRNLVRVGQRVAQGDQIAEMGSTGFSTGPHVHFEIHVPEQGAVNPVAYLIR